MCGAHLVGADAFVRASARLSPRRADEASAPTSCSHTVTATARGEPKIALVQRRIISGGLAASIVGFAFVICCTSAPVWAELMQRRGCCSQHCRLAPVTQPAFFITPVTRNVERPDAIVDVLSSRVMPHVPAVTSFAI